MGMIPNEIELFKHANRNYVYRYVTNIQKNMNPGRSTIKTKEMDA